MNLTQLAVYSFNCNTMFISNKNKLILPINDNSFHQKTIYVILNYIHIKGLLYTPNNERYRVMMHPK